LIELKKGVYWVGAIDWNLRNFHGYITQRGTTYNSYLVIDDSIALVDFVKAPFYNEMVRRIEDVVDPSEIDYLICNHIEPDHSGALLGAIEAAGEAELIASEQGKKGLRRYYGEDLRCTAITEKPSVSLGSKTLEFVATPMVHWPDSMVTYIPEDKLLLSNDAFGQHLATSNRFDDEVDHAVLMQESEKYYSNIVMPLWRSVSRAFKGLSGLDIEMIAPSHGVVWRGNLGEILGAYRRWVEGFALERAVVVYDTMWGSTEKLAEAVTEGIASEGVEVRVHRLGASHNSDVIADILEAKAVLVGCPTINNGLFPSVASFLSYMKGLKPKDKIGAFFGSYGWGGGAKREAEAALKSAGVEVVDSGLDFIYRPSLGELKIAVEFGIEMAGRIRGKLIH
jgi:flavorubredoxin